MCRKSYESHNENTKLPYQRFFILILFHRKYHIIFNILKFLCQMKFSKQNIYTILLNKCTLAMLLWKIAKKIKYFRNNFASQKFSFYFKFHLAEQIVLCLPNKLIACMVTIHENRLQGHIWYAKQISLLNIYYFLYKYNL